MKKLKKYTKVEIIWHDAFTRDNWEPEVDAVKYCNRMLDCTSIGYVLNVTKKQLTICHSRNKYTVMGILHIPIGCIKKINGFK